jgi:hypothetical protein
LKEKALTTGESELVDAEFRRHRLSECMNLDETAATVATQNSLLETKKSSFRAQGWMQQAGLRALFVGMLR